MNESITGSFIYDERAKLRCVFKTNEGVFLKGVFGNSSSPRGKKSSMSLKQMLSTPESSASKTLETSSNSFKSLSRLSLEFEIKTVCLGNEHAIAIDKVYFIKRVSYSSFTFITKKFHKLFIMGKDSTKCGVLGMGEVIEVARFTILRLSLDNCFISSISAGCYHNLVLLKFDQSQVNKTQVLGWGQNVCVPNTLLFSTFTKKKDLQTTEWGL